ncbi:MAG: o-succinylbenzoate synthase [Actinomycetota bacterium]|nr:o-succinylbenzoate synthase [Actinomycetota bacterium]
MTGSTGDRTGLGDVDSPDVREIKIERMKLTYRSPINTAHGPIGHREVVVLTLTDDEGRVGVGEAAPLANFTPESVDEAELAIHRWADHGALPAGSPTARAAIDGALLDLAAQAACRPVHDLLAPGSSKIVPVSALVGGDTPDDLATAAAEAVASGHRTVKVKVAAGPFSADLTRLTAVRAAIGDTRLRIDANGGWGPDEASEYLTRLADLDLELVEEPVAGLEALAEIRKTSPVPVAVDESARTIDDVRRTIALGSADLVILKPSALGGPLITAEIARVVTEAGLGLVVTSLLEGSIGIRAAAHLTTALGALDPAPGLATAVLLTADSGPPLLPTEGALVLD